MFGDHELPRAARELADALAREQLRLVLAESCTGGNVAAMLANVPGISTWLCGSFVVYRNQSKTEWLNIPLELLDDPHIGPVSSEVTALLAREALNATPEADVSVAVTGHIGPGSPAHLDGQVFFAFARRGHSTVSSRRRRLLSPAPAHSQDFAARQQRLRESTRWVLEQTHAELVTLDG